MTDTVELKRLIKESGITLTHIAEKLGCSRTRLYSILRGADATASEIYALTQILHLDPAQKDAVFFASESE
jgi:transcriptional regulator with XRE-family HTH domain